MTKNKKYCFALATFVLVSCSNEEMFRDSSGEISEKEGRRELRLNIPNVGSGVIPYSIATESESKIVDFDVYVFGKDTVSNSGNFLLEEIFRKRAGLTLNDAGSDKTATISLKGTNAKRLYYVANSYRNGVNTLSLDSVELNKTTTTQFRAKLTDPIPVHLSVPLLMTDSSVVNDPVSTTSLSVELKRSMARFDVINDTYDTNFEIQFIEVQKARAVAYIFPQLPSFNGPVIGKMERIDFKALSNANKGETNSAFYLYPSVVNGETTLSLIGLYGNVKTVYPVKFVNKKGTVLPITANKRYIIEVAPSGASYIDATIRVAEWILGDTIHTPAGDGSIKLSLHPDEVGKTFSNNTLTLAAAQDEMAVMDVECDSEWEFANADIPSWISVDTTGYSYNKVANAFKLVAKEANPSGKRIRTGVVTLRNVRNKALTQPLVVRQLPNALSSIDLVSNRLVNNELRLTGAIDSVQAEVILGGTSAPDSYTYTIDPTGSWLTITTGALPSEPGDKYLLFKTKANQSNDTLHTTVTLLTNNGLKQLLLVSQAPQVLNLSAFVPGLRDGKLILQSSAAERVVSIEAKELEEWDITTQSLIGTDDSWISFEPGTKGFGSGSFTLKAAENGEMTERSVRVMISYTKRPDVRASFIVAQQAAP